MLKHVVVCAVGSGGDVLPFVEVAAAIAARGFSTTLLAPQRYRPHATLPGLRFESIGADAVFDEVFDGAEVWHPTRGTAAAWRYYGAAMRSGFQRIVSRWSPADTALVSSSFAVAARLAEEARGFRNTTVHLSPALLWSAERPARWAKGSVPPHWPLGLRKLLMGAAERFILDPLIGAQVNPFRAELGLPAQTRLFSHWLNSPRQVLYAFPSWLAAAAADWPAQGEFAGFPQRPVQRRFLPAAVQAFVEADRAPLVVVTAGTAVAHGPQWLAHCVAGARALGCRVIVVGPEGSSGRGGDPGVLRARFLPFETLLPQAHLMVHHAGIGTMAEAMRSGVPQLVLPTAHDQFDNAARLAALGCGMVGQAAWSPQQFQQAIARLVGRSSERQMATNIRMAMREQGDGAARIAALALGGAQPAMRLFAEATPA